MPRFQLDNFILNLVSDFFELFAALLVGPFENEVEVGILQPLGLLAVVLVDDHRVSEDLDNALVQFDQLFKVVFVEVGLGLLKALANFTETVR